MMWVITGKKLNKRGKREKIHYFIITQWDHIKGKWKEVLVKIVREIYAYI
jgi:hypothetical protein